MQKFVSFTSFLIAILCPVQLMHTAQQLFTAIVV